MAGAALLKHCRQILCMKCMNTADHQLIVSYRPSYCALCVCVCVCECVCVCMCVCVCVHSFVVCFDHLELTSFLL